MMDSETIWRRVKADTEALFAPFGAGVIDNLPAQTQNIMRVVAVQAYTMALEDNASAVEEVLSHG